MIKNTRRVQGTVEYNNDNDIDGGRELAQRVAEQWAGFWDQEEADKDMPVRTLTRSEITKEYA